MAALRFGRLAAVLVGCGFLVSLALAPTRADACPFCSAESKGPTLVGDFNQATVVMVGTFSNPQRKGDVLLCVGQVEVANSFDVERALWDARPGQQVAVRVLRGSQTLTVNLVLRK